MVTVLVVPNPTLVPLSPPPHRPKGGGGGRSGGIIKINHHHHPSYPAALGFSTGKKKQEPLLCSPHSAAEADQDELSPSSLLPLGLQRELLPKHVAVIMDGNSRWAASRGLPVSAGHEAGYRSLKDIVTLSCRWGIRALTVFAFSSENWLRPKTEIDFLMMLFENVLKENLTHFLREGIRICIIGDLLKLPRSLQKLAQEVEESTKNNSQFDLIVAISYSGRSDIVQACQRIGEKIKQGLLEPTEITESLIAQELETNRITNFNYPDLLIRTSGELRLSNFLLWQSAYTELYFTKVHWPDFREADYIEALSSFQMRQRRFGQRTV